MHEYLDRLLQRALQTEPPVRPRSPSLFERPAVAAAPMSEVVADEDDPLTDAPTVSEVRPATAERAPETDFSTASSSGLATTTSEEGEPTTGIEPPPTPPRVPASPAAEVNEPTPVPAARSRRETDTAASSAQREEPPLATRFVEHDGSPATEAPPDTGTVPERPVPRPRAARPPKVLLSPRRSAPQRDGSTRAPTQAAMTRKRTEVLTRRITEQVADAVDPMIATPRTVVLPPEAEKTIARAAETDTPAVHVRIDKVEVNATGQWTPERAKPRRAELREPRLTLAEYLEKRNTGRR